MGFFDRLYYGKAGKRDYSEADMPKNRVSLFFLVLKDHVFDLVKVNLLQVIFWLPFLLWTYVNLAAIQSIDAEAMLAAENGTQALLSAMGGYLIMWLLGLVPCLAITGPSSAGAAYVMRNWARDQHAFLMSDFKDAFKGNWKQALGVSVITALVPVLAYTAMVCYGGMATSSPIMLLPLLVVFSATLMWALMLPQMLLARLITLIPVAALLLGLYMGSAVTILIVSLYYLLFGFAFARLLYASVANGLFDRYLNPRIEGAPVNLGLRPQSEEDELSDDDDEDDEDE